MSRTCSCGETFESLTAYRIHQRDDCPDRDADLDVLDEDLEEIAATATDELLLCDVCGHPNDGAETIATDETEAGLSIELSFCCDWCGATNENTAILAGGQS